jgi:RNA polymerase sigma-70 factor (ECF subfamily)
VSEEAAPEFSRIYETYHGRVLAYAAKLLGREEAEDVAQEVFLKIGRSLATLADPAKLTSWIYAITLNTVRDAARRRASSPIVSSADSASPDEGAEPPIARLPDSGSRTPEEVAIRREMVACYLEYVKQLPPGYYGIYLLSEFEHLPHRQIARRLGLSEGTVKIRLHRARARLAEELRRNCRCYYNERGELMGEPKRL